MTKEKSIKMMKDLYDRLTNPEIRSAAKRETERKERIKEKKSDSGL